jgi:hypothetical protein
MIRVLLAFAYVLIPTSAFSFGAISCDRVADRVVCAVTVNFPNANIAQFTALDKCSVKAHAGCIFPPAFSDTCNAAYYTLNAPQTFYFQSAATASEAKAATERQCMNLDPTHSCRPAVWGCDGTADPHASPNQVAIYDSASFLNIIRDAQPSTNLLNPGAIGAGISFGIGVIIALLIYAKHSAIANFVIHGNLPSSLPVYAEDIQVLFKRSQRVNWYGRVVFGIIARLGMTEQQLSLVRRYWLGRVIAFDSLRRQRQSELARMHLQLAAAVKSEPKDKKALSQFFAFVKTVFLSVFYLLRALFSFLFGFLFIRITIAKLARGKLIESKDLILVLQAKEAIEETARYLKEYLTVAETFDGREELFESK